MNGTSNEYTRTSKKKLLTGHLGRKTFPWRKHRKGLKWILEEKGLENKTRDRDEVKSIPEHRGRMLT